MLYELSCSSACDVADRVALDNSPGARDGLGDATSSAMAVHDPATSPAPPGVGGRRPPCMASARAGEAETERAARRDRQRIFNDGEFDDGDRAAAEDVELASPTASGDDDTTRQRGPAISRRRAYHCLAGALERAASTAAELRAATTANGPAAWTPPQIAVDGRSRRV